MPTKPSHPVVSLLRSRKFLVALLAVALIVIQDGGLGITPDKIDGIRQVAEILIAMIAAEDVGARVAEAVGRRRGYGK
jgi:hypothetical protein